MEQKRPADIFQELLDYLWNGLGLEEKGWKRAEKRRLQKKMKNGLTYQIWFDRSRYNYIDYEIGHGNVEVGFTCIIKQGDDCLYSFKIEPTTGGSFFRMLTEDLRLNTGLLDTFLPLVKANYLRLHRPLRGRPRGGITAGLRPLHRGGGLQLVHLCAGADGGTVRNGGADGGVPPSGGIARNAWTQGKELDGFDVIPPIPRQ